jgi:NAD(P)-dependent dehydrogenase (short-subunit alcohol dehydrogenase family)
MTWSMSSGLEGKGVIVTGAAGGIGREVVRAFAAAGAQVAAVDLRKEPVEELVASLGKGSHLALCADLRDIGGHEAMLQNVRKRFGTLDVLAHVAGVLIRRKHVDEVTEADWDLQHDVNLKATFFLNRAVARMYLQQGRGGRIINFTSQGWWTGGFGGSVVYAATKGGIVSLTRGLARTYAKDRITVNAVSPGAVDTEMLFNDLSQEQVDQMVAQIPIGRVAAPTDLAGAVIFLASDHASYVTGATINVSGGWLMY